MIKDYLQDKIKGVLGPFNAVLSEIHLEHPAEESHGDYASNVAMVSWKNIPQEVKDQIGVNSPRGWAEYLKGKLDEVLKDDQMIERIEIAGPGFINFTVSQTTLLHEFLMILKNTDEYGKSNLLVGKKYMVEYGHPNTHKEMHIGHMRTLITGESLARILEKAGAEVFRANYQGDIGPHVAKSIWGTQKLLDERGKSWNEAEQLTHAEKAHLLGEGYVLGNQSYEDNKEEIDTINNQIYSESLEIMPIYERTRRWSLDYYDELYARFYTHYNKLYLESDVDEKGKTIVKNNLGKVFTESNGAIIFDGEPYGLHKRVFITQAGNPTYEAKEMGLAPVQFDDFPFDVNIHVVANEQADYFKVVIKALELIDPTFKDRAFHLSMGMVQLVGRKMSSRTGVIITVDGLLEDVKSLLLPLIHNPEISDQDKEQVAEEATIAAVKYSVLKNNTHSNVSFDIEQSINLNGDSGPYLQYTHARCASVLSKLEDDELLKKALEWSDEIQLEKEELDVMRMLYRFSEVIVEAAREYAPNVVCLYLFELAQRFNTFYNKHSILDAETEQKKILRLKLTAAVQQVLANGLGLLGIKAPERM